jgi:murein DD-endopeptidase MepM/ murein hydrolase activator NlpD
MPTPSPLPRHVRHARAGARWSSAGRLRLSLAAGALLLLTAIVALGGLPGSPRSPVSDNRSPEPIGAPLVLPTPSPERAGQTATPGTAASPSPTPTPTPSVTAVPPEPASVAPDELRGYFWPLRGARLTSRFGQRDDGNIIVTGERYHDGMDLATWCGDRVRAAHAGTVLYAGRKFDEHVGYSDSLAGFYARLDGIGGLRLLPIVVVIDDGNGYRSLYAHLAQASVEIGDVVAAGEVIGLEGATGRATGCHLHYALIRMDGAWLNVAPEYVDKLSYPPFVRQRVDPLLALPLRHVDAPLKVQRENAIPIERRSFVLELD